MSRFRRILPGFLTLIIPVSLVGQEKEKSIEELVAETERQEAAFRAEGAFQAKPVYDAMILPSETTKRHTPIKLPREHVDAIAALVQGFYKRYNPMGRQKVLEDPAVSDYLTADFIEVLKNRAKAEKLVGGYVVFPGLSPNADLYKYYGVMKGPRKGYYLADFAVGWTKGEIVYESHMWVVLRYEDQRWKIDDLRDMGNG